MHRLQQRKKGKGIAMAFIRIDSGGNDGVIIVDEIADYPDDFAITGRLEYTPGSAESLAKWIDALEVATPAKSGMQSMRITAASLMAPLPMPPKPKRERRRNKRWKRKPW